MSCLTFTPFSLPPPPRHTTAPSSSSSTHQPGSMPARNGHSSDESKAEQYMDDDRHVYPFEMEEGQPDAFKPVQRTTCQRHPGKFACLGVTIPVLLLLGILTAVFYPRKPHVALYSSSLLEIDGFTGTWQNKSGGAPPMNMNFLSCSSFFIPHTSDPNRNRRHSQLRHKDREPQPLRTRLSEPRGGSVRF